MKFIVIHSRKVDIWSLGVTLLAMLPLGNSHTTKLSNDAPIHVIMAQVDTCLVSTLPGLETVLRLCLNRSPGDRASIQTLQQQPLYS